VGKIKILAIESSAKAVSAAVCEDGKIIAQSYQNSGLTHSRTLLPIIEDMLKNSEIKLLDIALIAVAKGPGSFTGIRIGVAAAKGLSWAAQIPAVGVSTLEAMAYQSSFAHGIICPVMDARRSEVYNALFETRGGELVRLCEDRAISLFELSEEMKKSGKTYFLVGDGAGLCYNNLLDKDVSAVIAPEHLRYQCAYGVAMAASGKEGCDAHSLKPVYLRLSQAEREMKEREKEKGRIE